MPDWMQIFTMDIFDFPFFKQFPYGTGIQVKVVTLLLPVLFMYWLSEVVWRDSTKWMTVPNAPPFSHKARAR